MKNHENHMCYDCAMIRFSSQFKANIQFISKEWNGFFNAVYKVFVLFKLINLIGRFMNKNLISIFGFRKLSLAVQIFIHCLNCKFKCEFQ